jgi:CRISPR-associated protein Csd2
MTAIQQRHEFVLFFDVKDGNPNGDPDMDNMPRRDPDTDHGLVTDVCLKRKIRNFVDMAKEDETGFRIFVQENSVLNETQREAYRAVRAGDKKVETQAKLNPANDKEQLALVQFMCDNFFDIRTFGAVMGTSINCGQVRGPVQLGMARSIEAITVQENSITRMAATNEAEKKAKSETSSEGAEDKRTDNRTMGRKHIVPYGLYRVHGFISASLAAKTGFTDDDLGLLFQALQLMFDHDRSAARGEMSARRLIVFKHESKLGNAPAQSLFDRITVARKVGNKVVSIGDESLQSAAPARAFSDYQIDINAENLPTGVQITELL